MKKTQIDDLPSSLNRTLIVGWMRVRLHCHRSISPICCCPHLDVWLPFSNAADCRGKFAVYHDTKSHTVVDQWHRLSHNVTSPGYPLWHSAPFRPLARFVELRGMQRRKKMNELHGKKLVRFLWTGWKAFKSEKFIIVHVARFPAPGEWNVHGASKFFFHLFTSLNSWAWKIAELARLRERGSVCVWKSSLLVQLTDYMQIDTGADFWFAGNLTFIEASITGLNILNL